MIARNPLNRKWVGPLSSAGVPQDVIERMSGTDDEADFKILMEFFCNRWGGTGCKIEIHPDNAEALGIFRVTGPGARQSDVEAAMRLAGVENFRDCWHRVIFLNSEYGKIRSIMAKK